MEENRGTQPIGRMLTAEERRAQIQRLIDYNTKELTPEEKKYFLFCLGLLKAKRDSDSYRFGQKGVKKRFASL